MRTVLGLFLILWPVLLSAQNPTNSLRAGNPNRDPDAARLITSDITNFWRAYDSDPKNRRTTFQREYFDKGSEGLVAFKRERIDRCGLVETITSHPGFYNSIRPSTLQVDSMKPQIVAGFHKLKSLYSDAVFPNVYFLIGCMDSAGTATDEGLLIGTEMYSRNPQIPDGELDSWLRQVLKPIDQLPQIVAHELIHYQQKYGQSERTLLRQTIREGSADFIGEMISGGNINAGLRDYADAREEELWDEFRREMNGTDMSRWLHQGESAKDRPADLGYYVGYKICEAYYRNARDKKQAVKDILLVDDLDAFVKRSGYENKFHRTSH